MTLETGRVAKQASGSVLVTCGSTKVLCTASVEDGVPPWLSHSGKGWLTAEYSMLPGSTGRRKAREGRTGKVDSRGLEISRLVGPVQLDAILRFARQRIDPVLELASLHFEARAVNGDRDLLADAGLELSHRIEQQIDTLEGRDLPEECEA